MFLLKTSTGYATGSLICLTELGQWKGLISMFAFFQKHIQASLVVHRGWDF